MLTSRRLSYVVAWYKWTFELCCEAIHTPRPELTIHCMPLLESWWTWKVVWKIHFSLIKWTGNTVDLHYNDSDSSIKKNFPLLHFSFPHSKESRHEAVWQVIEGFFFLTDSQNIYCVYSLKLHRQGDFNKKPNQCFLAY